jgi:hypothetical protein
LILDLLPDEIPGLEHLRLEGIDADAARDLAELEDRLVVALLRSRMFGP